MSKIYDSFQICSIQQGMKKCRGCRKGWTRHKFHCYKVIPRKMSWHSASRYCRSIEGNLTSVNSQQENKFITGIVQTVQSRLSTTPRPYFWIGARSVTENSNKCEDFTFEDNSMTSYNNFTGSGSGSACSCIKHSYCRCVNVKCSGDTQGVWLYHNCSFQKPFVCKYKLVLL